MTDLGAIASRPFLLSLFRAAVDAASPARCLPPHLPRPPKGRTIVVGAGKAAAAMAATVEQHWAGEFGAGEFGAGELSGLVITRYGHGVPTSRIEVVEAGHPLPDEAGLDAARRIRALADGLTKDDMLLCLWSGGGSALLTAPAPGVSLADKQALNRALLRSGATIAEINCVRRHLSTIKGGRLALAAAPAKVVSLMISDVPGDDPAVIASGPTCGDATTLADARAVLARFAIAPPPSIAAALADPANETPSLGDPHLRDVRNLVIATPQHSLEAAAEAARRAGVTPVLLGDALEGEARMLGTFMAGMARSCRRHGAPGEPPCVLISGGETSVTVRGAGRGGRNMEFLAGLALALNGEPAISALAGDTDGIDGTEAAAGAFIGPETLRRAAGRGLDVSALLNANDCYTLFERLRDLVVTGPTRTNVNDFRAVLIDRRI